MNRNWTRRGRRAKRVTRPAVVALSLLAGWVIAIYGGLLWFMHRED
jgi:hypothetical protein